MHTTLEFITISNSSQIFLINSKILKEKLYLLEINDIKYDLDHEEKIKIFIIKSILNSSNDEQSKVKGRDLLFIFGSNNAFYKLNNYQLDIPCYIDNYVLNLQNKKI